MKNKVTHNFMACNQNQKANAIYEALVREGDKELFIS